MKMFFKCTLRVHSPYYIVYASFVRIYLNARANNAMSTNSVTIVTRSHSDPVPDPTQKSRFVFTAALPQSRVYWVTYIFRRIIRFRANTRRVRCVCVFFRPKSDQSFFYSRELVVFWLDGKNDCKYLYFNINMIIFFIYYYTTIQHSNGWNSIRLK